MVTSIQEEMKKEDEMPEDDTDDEAEKQALIEEVMARIELPEYKETIITGEELIDKINELPLDEENKIDYARLKNVPQIKGKVISGSPTVISNAVDLDGSTRQAGYSIVWDADRGRYTHAAGGGSGSPGGSDTQVQFNDGGSFGGDAGLTYNKTTDSLTIGGGLTVDTDTLFVDATNNRVGIGTASPLTQTGNKLQEGDNSEANQYLVFQTNNGTERGIQYYLLDGTTLRGYMKWTAKKIYF